MPIRSELIAALLSVTDFEETSKPQRRPVVRLLLSGVLLTDSVEKVGRVF